MEFNKRDKVRISGIIKNKVVIGPKKINIHINNYCNHNCLFCWYHSPMVSKQERKTELSLDVLKNVIDDCSDIGVDIIDLEAEGELFLYPRIRELIRYIRSRGMRIFAYTNADFLNIDAKDIDIDWMRINISAGTEETYSKMHVSGKPGILKKVLKNTRILAMNPHTRITLVYIITELNWMEIGNALKICEKTGSDEIIFKLVEATEETKSLIPSEASVKKLMVLIKNLLNKNCRVKHNLNEIMKTISSNEFGKFRFSIKRTILHNDRHFYFSAEKEKHECYVPWFYSYIDVHGRVIAPCDNGGTFVIGNVKEERFRDIWFSDKYMKKRILAKKIDINQERWQQCRYCTNIQFNAFVKEAITAIKRQNQ